MTDENKTQPESQSVSGCAGLRQECRSEIFGHIDGKHKIEMDAIGEVGKTVSYMKGKMDGKAKWGQVIIEAIIQRIPEMVFLLILGIIYWLKTEGKL